MDNIKIPYSFEEIDIGKTDKTKRKAIESNKGRLAVVGDEHYEPFHPIGMLRNGDAGVYFLDPAGEGSIRRLHYHDLTKLLVGFP